MNESLPTEKTSANCGQSRIFSRQILPGVVNTTARRSRRNFNAAAQQHGWRLKLSRRVKLQLEDGR